MNVGSVTLSTGATLVATLATASNQTAAPLVSTGPVNLAGAMLDVMVPSLPAVGTALTVVSSNAPVQGTFAGLGEGSHLTLASGTYRVTYVGGSSGDDVQLIALGDVAPPVVNVPPTAPLIPPNSNLVFSIARSNAISISDPAVGNSPIQVTLSTTAGTLSLGSVAGLTFIAGTGTGNTTMTFVGTVAAINSDLDGLVFSSPSAFVGTAQIVIAANDLGNGNSIQPQTTTGQINVGVDNVNLPPSVTISASVNGGTPQTLGNPQISAVRQ